MSAGIAEPAAVAEKAEEVAWLEVMYSGLRDNTFTWWDWLADPRSRGSWHKRQTAAAAEAAEALDAARAELHALAGGMR